MNKPAYHIGQNIIVPLKEDERISMLAEVQSASIANVDSSVTEWRYKVLLDKGTGETACYNERELSILNI